MTERELFDEFKLDVYKTAYYMLKKREDAEDVLQDVFIKAFQRGYEKIENKKPWLLSITMNECRNYLRKKSRIFFLNDFKNESISLESSNSTEETLEVTESEKELVKIISTLNPKIREVMLLKYLHVLKNEEIATTLNIPLGTVKSRANKGLKQLKQTLERQNMILIKRRLQNERTREKNNRSV